MGIRDALEHEGYFELPPRVPPALIARVRDDVERCVAAGAPATAAFLFAPMWELLDHVVPVAEEALGEVSILPAFWAWRIAPGALGWNPHRDGPDEAFDDDLAPRAISIWIPLADATTRNGCMHVVPRYWDYEYFNPHSRGQVTQQQYLRALPAAAGSLLGWTHGLLHWGGACAPGEAPRVSTSFELARAAEDRPGSKPPSWRPDAAERVEIVRAMIAKYPHMQEVDAGERAAIDALAAEAMR